MGMDDNQPSQDRTSSGSNNPNVFDDEFAVNGNELVDDNPLVADGFRPTHAQGQSSNPQRRGTDQGASEDPPSRHQSTSDRDVPPVASRNSTSKRNDTRAYLSQSRGASDVAVPRRMSTRRSLMSGSYMTGLAHRMSISSTASFATLSQSQTPYQGNSGPSHPYAMYPQGTVAPQVPSTTSTPRLPERTHSESRPAHPYAMYPQNVEEGSGPDTAAEQPAIPVGFPGLGQAYHRRIGPDGEELDIIGPDGHTEQLPPYTRYAEDAPTKTAAPASVTEIPAQESLQDLTNSRDELLSAGDGARASRIQIDLRSNGDQSTPTLENTEALGTSEKAWREKTWREKRKTLILGRIPCWVALLIVTLVLVVALIVGVGVGALLSKKVTKSKDRHGPPPAIVTTYVTTTTMFDATPIARPSDFPDPLIGSWLLPVTVPQEANHNCLPLGNQSAAWSCDIPPTTSPPILLKVSYSPAGLAEAEICPLTPPLLYGVPIPRVPYGVQPPTIQAKALRIVYDSDEPAKGPAYQIQGYYDKVVVLAQNQLSLAPLSKRDHPARPEFAPFRRRPEAKTGETLWLCYWNQTFIEAYMYPETNSSAATQSTTPGTVISTSPPSSPGAALSATPTSSSTNPKSTADPTTLLWAALRGRDGGQGPSLPPIYPRVVKIEERRLPNAPEPYCNQVLLSDKWILSPVTNIRGEPIVVNLTENNPALSEFNIPTKVTTSTNGPSSTLPARRVLQQRDDPPGACHCQWLMT